MNPIDAVTDDPSYAPPPMENWTLGSTGLRVSRIALGCGGFGGVGSAPAFFGMGESEGEALRILDRAFDAGITLLDTADAYGGGRSEAAIGKWLQTRGPRVREQVIVSSKVFHPVGDDPADRGGLSRSRIHRQITGSLRRLRTDHLDLYLIHERDPATPLEVTLGALDDLVRAGKVRFIGASNVDASWMKGALAVSEANGLARFEWVQNGYSLLDRRDERDLLPLCAVRGLGFTPFSPLAGGWLTGKYRRGEAYPQGSRMTLRPEGYARIAHENTYRALERFEQAAAIRGVDKPTLAIAWVLANPAVTSAIVGARRPEQLDPAIAALSLSMTASERAEIASLFEA
ncbi:MAG: aldo/keto reductase [Planctomycetes bacterium]|nr:aldo/keto reductase [Planctomycetota bacterium]MBI3847880.1 aldo/keto reductase [Planctomycetota bacterium]